MSDMHELLVWSLDRPLWQQDALRRLAETGSLDDGELDQITELALLECGALLESTHEAAPLTADHIAESDEQAPRTVIGALGPIENIDRLAEQQPPIRFSVSGLTVVYGPNGSGKSGYCRVAKHLCQSPDPKPLASNVFSPEERPHRVTVAFREGDTGAIQTVTWSDGEAPPPALSRIAIFDSDTARVYVDKSRKLEFLPLELDLMNKLALVLREVDRRAEEKSNDIYLQILKLSRHEPEEGTSARRIFQQLFAEAISEVPSDEEIEAASRWSEEDDANLNKLEARKRADPTKIAEATLSKAGALRALLVSAKAISKHLDDSRIADLKEIRAEMERQQIIASQNADELFSGEPIPSVGGTIWRAMFSHAMTFATEVYPDALEPKIANADVCVLCQQNMTAEASERLNRFVEFIQGRALETFRSKELELREAVSEIEAISVPTSHLVQTLLARTKDASSVAATLAEKVECYLEAGRRRLADLKAALAGEVLETTQLTTLPECPVNEVEETISALENRSARLVQEADDPTVLSGRQDALAELRARKALHLSLDSLLEAAALQRKRAAVIECRKTCRIAAVTRRITERRRDVLTPRLEAALQREISGLQLSHLPLKLHDRGAHGDSLIEIALEAERRISANSRILSEGEQRALALAAFFAELGENINCHGIIIDDPVSSLDYDRVKLVANRLVAEAKSGRQVVVFTHNIVFLHMLTEEARQEGVPAHREWVGRLGDSQFGLVGETVAPAPTLKIKDRLSVLRRELAELEQKAQHKPGELAKRDVTAIYAQMREAWEKSIEEILFNGCIERFRPSIETSRLDRVRFDPTTDYKVIHDNMKKVSTYSGHDRADELPDKMPHVDEIKADFEQLDSFVSDLKTKYKELEAQRAGERLLSPEPELIA